MTTKQRIKLTLAKESPKRIERKKALNKLGKNTLIQKLMETEESLRYVLSDMNEIYKIAENYP